MNKLRYILILFLSICFLNPPKSAGQTLFFKNYSVNQGLASSTVYSMLQDSKGFIWFATESGVNRFDGKNFELFTIDNGLSDNEVLQIKEDSQGRIWFLTLNGKLSYFLNKRFYNHENDNLLKKTISKGSFVSFFEDSQHHIWLSTNQNKLLEIKGNSVKSYSSNIHSLTNAFVFENSKKQICIINKEHLLVFKNNKFRKLSISELPISEKAITRNKFERSLTFLSPTGLIKYKNGYTHVLDYLPENIDINSANNFIIDRKRNIWLSTMGTGLYVINYFSQKFQNHLKDNIITDLINDIQGNIWVSTIGNGVYMLPYYAQSTLNYTATDGLNSNAVHSILKVNGKLILGLRDGNIDLLDNNQIIHQNLNEKDYNPVKQLFYDKERQSVWFASNNQLGELNLKSGKINFLREEHDALYAVKDFSISKSGKIALALASGVYLIQNKNNKLVFNAKDKPKHQQYLSRAFSVFYDSAERLWFSNINGLFCQYGTVPLFENHDVISQRITDIAELPDGSLICSTFGYGVFILKDFKPQKILNTDNGLISNICKKIYVNGNNVWLVTGKGLSKIDLTNYKTTNYSKENGLSTSEVNDLFLENDTIYAATNNGLSIISHRQNPQTQVAPRLYLNQFLANKKTVKTDTLISLSYKKNNITISYIALDFEHPGYVKYSYKLNPEAKWIETSNSTLEFASLQPGTYYLQIKAKSLNSDWSTPLNISFTINPPFYKTWWFILVSLIGTGLLIWFIFNKYYRTKRAKENEQLLTRTKIISLEQQALQAMMNPHFVFNVMNSIQYFINTKDNTMANQALTGFARLLRKNLENCNKSYITIEEELTYLHLYLSLEKMRFGERMNYSIKVSNDIHKEETFIPSMLLQPFVENAIWHGLMPKEDNGNIWITISLKTTSILEIEIKDDGVGINNSLQQKTEAHISRGMQLTTERIKLLNKFKVRPIEIDIKQTEPEGTKVSIKIPL